MADSWRELIQQNGSNKPKQPKLSIPKKIADALDAGDLMILAWTHANDLLGKVPDEERKTEIIRRNALARAYSAGKALGVELVEVEG